MSEDLNNDVVAKENNSLVELNDKVENKFVQLIQNEYPVAIKEGINDVMNIIRDEKSITDLYPHILAEVPISQSQFQDQCVQMEQHFTSHKKLRQAVMEMQDRLNALYAAKTGQKKAILKVEKYEVQIQVLHRDLDQCEDDLNSRLLEIKAAQKIVDLEEAQRGLKDSSHLIKDAMLKVNHQRALVERYEAEVAETGLSYEEAEVVYYVMYFTSEAEKQLRTGDHQIDRGTFGAISQTPGPIRNKILNNISFLKQKLFKEGYPEEGDYLFKVYEDKLKPVKTDEGEFEGMKVQEFLGVETIKLLSLPDNSKE